jgi:hypothetical protein
MLKLICIILLIPIVTSSKTVPQADQTTVRIYHVLKRLQPKLATSQAYKLAQAIRISSDLNDLDWKLAISILHQESSLRMDPQSCKLKPVLCNDMGIGQIRFSVWGKALKIDKSRLLKDESYAVAKSFEVLAYYRDHYSESDKQCFTRYHSNKQDYRKLYLARLQKVYVKMGYTELR